MTNQLVLRRHTFDQDHGVFPVRAGQTLGAMLREGAQGAELSDLLEVRIGGIEVPRHLWDRVRPKEGAAIHVTGKLAGSGGWRQVLMIVVAVFATWITGGGAAGMLGPAFGAGTFGAAALGAAVMVAGTLAVNALIPPPRPTSSSGTEGRFNALTGSQNGINPYGPIPIVIGESRFYPPHAALPYNINVGEASYQYCLFDLGYLTPGAVVSDIRIGDTPIEDYDSVAFNVTTTPTLYKNDVSQESVNASMDYGDAVERTTAPDVEGIAIDIVYITGLFGVGTSGKDFAMDNYWDVHYREVGTTTWLEPPSPRLSGMVLGGAGGMYRTRQLKKKPFAVGLAWDVPVGQYEVRVTRPTQSLGGSDNTYVDDATWAVLRSIKHIEPSRTGTTKLELRIRATDQLNGTLQTLSCHVFQKIPVWDRDTDTWTDELTCNTGWIYRWLLSECPAFSKHVPASRINLEQIADYADFCETHGLETRRVLDARATAGELIRNVLAGSLGSLGQTNGQYGVVFDAGETQPSMSFTPAEARNFTGQRVFTRTPHALRVRFINPTANWEPDEIIVLDDGYSWRGKDARGNASSDPEPTTFEVLDLQQACYAQQAWQLGRHHFAQAKFRPSTYSWETDIAGLGCTRGDVVDVTSDVTEWGYGAGRVVAVDGTTVVLQSEIETEAGKTYRAQVRRVNADGGFVVTEAYDVTPHSPVTDTFYFATAPVVAPGDFVIVGETGNVTQKLILTGLRSAADLGFQMTAVAYDSRVEPYWTDPPATIISEITGRAIEPPDPPVVDGVTSSPDSGDPDDAGIYRPGVEIGVRPPDGIRYIEK